MPPYCLYAALLSYNSHSRPTVRVDHDVDPLVATNLLSPANINVFVVSDVQPLLFPAQPSHECAV